MSDVIEPKVKPTWGGARPGAGRPKGRWRSDPPHRKRSELLAKHPVHITLRARKWVDELRTRDAYKTTRAVLRRYLGLPDFRVVHLSIQRNHFHLIVEASSATMLTRWMRSLVITLAKALNRALGRSGKLFEFRYHDRQIRNPRQARNTLAYVLNNWRRHNQDISKHGVSPLQLDPYASGSMIPDWKNLTGTDPVHPPWPVSPPQTDLLRYSWLQFGRLDPFEVPGPIWR